MKTQWRTFVFVQVLLLGAQSSRAATVTPLEVVEASSSYEPPPKQQQSASEREPESTSNNTMTGNDEQNKKIGGNNVNVVIGSHQDDDNDDSCKDLDDRCGYWAFLKRCSNDYSFMKEHCPKSCQICKTNNSDIHQSSVCEDLKASCESMASKGACHLSPPYMTYHCPKSCGMCENNIRTKDTTTTETTRTTTTTTSTSRRAHQGQQPCLDLHQQCAEWASIGECSRNPNFMHLYCRKSCQICKIKEPCKDESGSCITWALQGECSRNPRLMHSQCRQSCKLCKSDTENDEIDYCIDRLDRSSNNDDNDNDNNYDKCDDWAYNGECSRNPSFMNVFCRKTCQCKKGGNCQICKRMVLDHDQYMSAYKRMLSQKLTKRQSSLSMRRSKFVSIKLRGEKKNKD